MYSNSLSPKIPVEDISWIIATWWANWMARNDYIFRGEKINPQKTISSVKDICKVNILNKGDYDRIPSKIHTMNPMENCDNELTICTDASFSSKDDKCSFGCAVFFKYVIV